MKDLIIALFAALILAIAFACAIVAASFLLRFSIYRLFNYNVDFLGLSTLILSLMMIKNLIFGNSKSSKEN